MIKRRVIPGILGIPFILLALALRPVPKATEKNVIEVTGRVANLFEGTSYDVNIHLANEPHFYYINRGIEQGLSIEDLRRKLMHQTVSLAHVKHWTTLDPGNRSRQVARLVYNSKVIFSQYESDAF